MQANSRSEDINPSAALRSAQELRDTARRERRMRERLYTGIVAATVFCALFYGVAIERPRYAAETRFAVRGSSDNTMPTDASSLLSTGSNTGAGSGFVGGFAVNDFVQSRDCMLQLAKVMDLQALLNGATPGKPGQVASEEALYRKYRDAISSHFDMVQQEVILNVSAFSPQASKQIADELLHRAQLFVERMDEQGVENGLHVAKGRLQKAERRAAKAAEAVAQWRASHGNVDPDAEATMVSQRIEQIEENLAAAQINYDRIRATGNPHHPMLKSAQTQMTELERQLNAAQKMLTGDKNSLTQDLKSYTQLKTEQTLAENDLAAARDAYQQASLKMIRLRRYVMIVSRPVPEDEPSSPNFPLLALESLLAGLMLAFLTSIGLKLAKEKRV